ncbi:DUF998 domain-containing protein [Halomarina ordinaria]|uniref:DUF998 domain-containing protein n=1 Tax=Halomarina ordinaria TaxID=3033939 RepID=A0ABD5UA60_9EURY|nr:DUF998 domain-containing protein [Halomarina sp. PSRA2]
MSADTNRSGRVDPGIAGGLLAPVVALGAIALATLRSPSFTWTGSALSDLGAPGAPTEWLFNGGLILGGLLALPFAYRVWTRGRNRLERAGAAVFALDALCLAGVGAFPIGTDLHGPFAVAFYLLLSLSLWVYGGGNALAGDRARGLVTAALGVLNLAAWAIWAAAFTDVAPGLALPESVGALVVGVWTATTALWLR